MSHEEMTAYQEHSVRRDRYRIHVREYRGAEPPIVLMHGFPDNLHLYDRLFPHLAPARRVIAFDFLDGAARTSRPAIRIRPTIKLAIWMP